MVSRPPSSGASVIVGLFIAAIVGAVVSAVFIMLGSSVLNDHFPAVPAFSFLESLILGAMWSTLFMQVRND